MSSNYEEEHRNLVEYQWFQSIAVEKVYEDHDYSIDDTEYNPFMNGFNFAVQLRNRAYDPTMFKFIWRVHGQEPVVVDVEPCNILDWPGDVWNDLQALPFANFLCPKDYSKLVLKGSKNINNSSSSYFSMEAVY